jgi:hypothetical protein
MAMSLKYRAPKECSAVVVKSDLDCENWVTEDVERSIVSLGDLNHTYVVKSIDEFNAGCCYDTSGEGDLSDLETTQFDGLSLSTKQRWPITSAAINFFVIQFMGFAYESVAQYLNFQENYRTETEHNDGLITKNFLFQFVNNYFVLFYIAYLRQIEFMGQKKECDKSCLGELQMQMAIVFIAKTIGLQLVELVKPFVAQHIEQTFEMKRQKKLVEAKFEAKVETGEVSLHEQANANAQQQEEYRENRSARITKDDLVQMGTYEKQTHMVNYENKGTFDDFVSPAASHVKKTSVSSSFSFVWTFDFLLSWTLRLVCCCAPQNEMAIQYGYVALFSPCFPLAPFFAFLNNVTEIRGDAWKLCKAFQRPSAGPQEDIGSWYNVLNIIGFIAVLTNATMIAFVGSQIAARDDIQVDWMQGHVAKELVEAGIVDNPIE